MGSATLLECFARSWRACKLPRPLGFLRPFQPIRCYPEAPSPRRWPCTYGVNHHTITSWRKNLAGVFGVCKRAVLTFYSLL